MLGIFKRILCNKQNHAITRNKLTREAINEINYQEMLEKIKQGTKLIDVRTKQEYMEGHFDNAILIPYYEISKTIQNIIPNKEQDIIVYCQNGGRSQKAYEILKQKGYNNVYNLKDGREGVL